MGSAPWPGFDVAEGKASATILASGQDIVIDDKGMLLIRQTPAVSVATGKPSSAQWVFRTRLTTIVRNSGNSLDFDAPELMEQHDNEIHLKYPGGVTVLYEHSQLGLEQRLVVRDRVRGDGPLRVRFDLPNEFTYEVDDDATTLRAMYEGRAVFKWRGLEVVDADGKRLGAQIELGKGYFEYRIDDQHAQYPIDIDPLSTAPDWQTSGGQGFSLYGRTTTVVGDVNGDGYDDVIVGQILYDNNFTNEGRVLLFRGAATGLSSTASWAVEGGQGGAWLGNSVSGVGDIDGDGYDDVIVSAPHFDEGGVTNSGAVFLFRGSSTGLETSPTWTGSAAEGDTSYGFGVAGMGDLNCDGIPDFVVGAPSHDVTGDGDGSGRVYIYYGTNSAPFVSSNADLVDEPANGSSFGRNVYIRGNVDADGDDCDDLVIGAPGYTNTSSGEGKADLHLGSTSGLASTAAWTAYGDQANAAFGANVTMADVNGDGYADVVVSADKFNTAAGSDTGKLFVFHGSTSGPSATADWTFDGDDAGAELGHGLISGLDINQDGYDDLVATAPAYTSQVTNEGAAFGFLGSPTGLNSTPLWELFSGDSNSRFGQITMSMGGDVNGDGYSDVVIGAALGDGNVSNGGVAYAYYGQPTCYIDGDVYDDGAANPDNTCEVCDVSQDVLAWTVLADGTACDDGSACTANDTCQAGVCEGSQSTDCDDGNPCTLDTCDPNTGQCVPDSNADGTICDDDGLSCTAHYCDDGSCGREITAGSCAINDTCYADGDLNPNNACLMCDTSISQTEWTDSPAGTACDNGQFCTVNDTCDGSGTCTAGQPRDCSGAQTQCSTGVSCSNLASQCLPTGSEPNGTACDDGNPCTTNDQCVDGSCGGTPVACTNENPCEIGSCNPSTGSCNFNSAPNGTSCVPSDDACSVGSCQAGVCSASTTINCDDGNPCTTNSCDPDIGCVHDPLAEGDACAEAECLDENTALPASTCDDSATCVDDSPVDCGLYVCSDGACLTACASNDDCAGDGWCDDNGECNSDNRAPVADAGGNQIVNSGDDVTLNGTASFDPDGDDITYQWTQLDGVPVSLDDSASATPQFTAPSVGDNDELLTFELVVNDSLLDSDPSTVDVLVRNEANERPTALISGPDSAHSGQTITLSASDSFDPDGDALSYSWSRTGGQPVPDMGAADQEDFEITFDDVTSETTYSFMLIVNDGRINSDPALHEVVVTPGAGDVGPDDDAGDIDQPIDNEAGDLSGSGCACDSVDNRAPIKPVWLVGVFVLGGLAMWRRRLL